MNQIQESGVVATVQRHLFTSRFFGGIGIPIPKNAPRLIFEAVRQGEFSRASRYFRGGEEVYRQAPESMTSCLKEIAMGGQAVAYRVCAEFVIDYRWYTVIETFADENQTQQLQDQTWIFEGCNGGWAITEVRDGKVQAPPE